MRKSTGIAALAAAGLIAAGAAAVPASAAPKSKGATTVAPSAITGSVLEGVLRPGSLGAAGARFGITGNPSSGVIKHVGGLAIDGSAGITGDEYLEIRNFWINTGTGFVSGDVEGVGRVDLFQLSDVYANGSTVTATLLFTDVASLAAVGSTAISGLQAGTATVVLS